MYTFWLVMGGLFLLVGLILSVVRYRELPLLVLLALQPLKQFLLIEVPVFRSIDPTLIAAVWLGVLILVLIPRAQSLWQEAPWSLIACQLFLAAWVLVSLLWTPAPSYGSYKGLRFAFLNTAVMLAPFSLLLDRKALVRLTVGVALIALIVYTKISIAPSYEASIFTDMKYFRAGFLYGCDAAPLSHQLAGSFCLGAVFAARRWWVRVLAILSLPPLMYGAWLTGTRASVLAMMVSAFLVLWLFGQKNKVLKGTGLVMVFVLMFVVAYVASPPGQKERITQGLTGVDESGQARLVHFRRAAEAFLANPVGAGIGSFATFSGGWDDRWFPHNIVLEAFAELGVLGGLALVFLFALFFWHVFRMRRSLAGGEPSRFYADAWLVATIASLCVALVTDDLADNRSVWMAMGVCVVAYRQCQLEAAATSGVTQEEPVLVPGCYAPGLLRGGAP